MLVFNTEVPHDKMGSQKHVENSQDLQDMVLPDTKIKRRLTGGQFLKKSQHYNHAHYRRNYKKIISFLFNIFSFSIYYFVKIGNTDKQKNFLNNYNFII